MKKLVSNRRKQEKERAEQKKSEEAMKAAQTAKREKENETISVRKQYEKDYPAGTGVIHRKFGYGVIKKSENGKITVHFDGEVEKVLSIEACVENKIISKYYKD